MSNAFLLILVVLFILSFIPIGVGAEYQDETGIIWIKLGKMRITVYPIKKRIEKRTIKQTKKKISTKIKSSTSSQMLSMAQNLLPIALRTGRRFRQKLVIDKLLFLLTVPGADDPAQGAIRYAQANALLGSMWIPFTEMFHVEDGRAAVRVNFESSHLVLQAQLVATLKIYQIVWIGIWFGWDILVQTIAIRKQKKQKEAI